MDVWEPTPAQKVILNLPATVEMATPNVYADQIEWFRRHVEPARRARALAAPAQRPRHRGGRRRAGGDGGRRPRGGHALRQRRAHRQRGRRHPRAEPLQPGRRPAAGLLRHRRGPAHRRALQPAARAPAASRTSGDLVYTAFSGSHQDAIKKGFEALGKNYDVWEVPYLPIDPHHVGRSYEAVIRVNSQSGKGGVAYIMKFEHGFDLPRGCRSSSRRSSRRWPRERHRDHRRRRSGPPSSRRTCADGRSARRPPDHHHRRGRRRDHRSRRRSGGRRRAAGRREPATAPSPPSSTRSRRDAASTFGCSTTTSTRSAAGADAMAVAYVEARSADGTPRWGVGHPRQHRHRLAARGGQRGQSRGRPRRLRTRARFRSSAGFAGAAPLWGEARRGPQSWTSEEAPLRSFTASYRRHHRCCERRTRRRCCGVCRSWAWRPRPSSDRPSSGRSLSWVTACCASSAVDISTKPKPRTGRRTGRSRCWPRRRCRTARSASAGLRWWSRMRYRRHRASGTCGSPRIVLPHDGTSLRAEVTGDAV